MRRNRHTAIEQRKRGLPMQIGNALNQPPTPPTNVVARPNGAGAIQVDWASVNGAATYRLFRGPSATGPWTQIYHDAASERNDSNDPTPHLIPGQPYYYYAVAVNSIGNSPPSSVFGPVTPSASPAIPGNLHAVAQTGSVPTINLAWDAVNGATYQVERSTSQGAGYLHISNSVTANFPDATVLVGVPYYYRVRAVLNGIASDPSDYAVATVLPVEQHTGLPGETPTLDATSYDGIASVYAWNWGNQHWDLNQTTFGTLSNINWNAKTIIMTHGWNAKLDVDANDFMGIFARTLNDRAYNVLAVDWYHNGQADGSDPNHNPDDGWNLFDANHSMTNGVKAAGALGTALVNAGIKPGHVMLIGHSNGAGFMAELASRIYQLSGRSIDELVALDAPWETNRIGTDANGTTDAEERNVISGNRNDGVLIIEAATQFNLIAGNYIGTDKTGALNLGNAWSGVSINNNASNNAVGGMSAAAGNTVAFSGFEGVVVLSGTGNSILENRIYSNTGLGIELKPSGVAFNDPGDPDSG